MVEAAPPATQASAAANGPAVPVVVMDTQEAGIRLVHALLACAEAVQQENFSAADALVKQIPMLASSQGGAMRKVAAYFGEALARRVYRFRPTPDSSLLDAAVADYDRTKRVSGYMATLLRAVRKAVQDEPDLA